MPGAQATREYERLHSKSMQMLAEDDLDEDTQAAIRRISVLSRRRLLATGEGKELSKKMDGIINHDGTFSMHARPPTCPHAHTHAEEPYSMVYHLSQYGIADHFSTNSYGLHSYGLFSYGLYSYGLHS